MPGEKKGRGLSCYSLLLVCTATATIAVDETGGGFATVTVRNPMTRSDVLAPLMITIAKYVAERE